MPTTYTPLATTTLGSAQATVTFSGISGVYTDLILVTSTQSVQATTYDNLIIQFNGDTASNYSRTRLNGFSGGATSDRSSNATSHLIGPITGTSFATSIFSIAITQIQNYSNTTTNKTAIWRSGSQDGYVQAGVGLWRSTSAITSIDIKTLSGSNLAAGSTFSLYGVASAAVVSGAKATGGDIVATDGTYWYHAFRSSGTFTPTSTLSCDVLVIGGGGGGGSQVGGGGGAGGVFYATSQSISSAQTVTVGGGGTGGVVSVNRGTNGSNSVFGSLTNGIGGGAGGNYIGSSAGANGGSGGGGSDYGGISTGGSATQTSTGGTGYGFGGGNGNSPAGGGGGGAAGAGTNAGGGQGGNGGSGTSLFSSWGSATGTGQLVSGTWYFAGGAAGASNTAGQVQQGANGGGGAGGGGSTVAPTAGLANTGGGGGGSRDLPATGESGGRGGSGLVIVRYAV